MGQLRTRKRGSTWEWSFEGAKINGKRSPISKGGYRTKADAIAADTQAKAKYDNAGRTFKPVDIIPQHNQKHPLLLIWGIKLCGTAMQIHQI
ncbi:MAG: hypothetical protein LIP16_16325 [Clostridium sp.]|nr:hypothetical protein [Clostridium sp.]